MKKRHTIMVAGFDHYQRQLSQFMDEENPDYALSKAELLDEYDPDDRIYRYERVECTLAVEHEPGNKFDPAALKVLADGEFIGYVPRGNLSVLRRLSTHPDLEMHVEIFGGPYKYLEYDEDEDFFGEMAPKYFKTQTVRDPFKAVMIFTWNS